MSGYLLTLRARDDLRAIGDYYEAEAGPRVARKIVVQLVEAFRFPAGSPGAGHFREDLLGSRPVRFWGVGSLLILYEDKSRPVRILTIVHGSRDIPGLFRARGF